MSVVDATLAELERLSAVETVEGATALALAQDLDGQLVDEGVDGVAFRKSTAPAAVAKQLLATMDVIRARTPVAKTKLDELRDRRRAG